MVSNSAASPAIHRIILACGLCLLAVIFAMEAKTAWFGPTIGPGSAVRAAKALPADMPRLIEHGIPVPDPIHPQIPFALLTTLAVDQANAADVPARSIASRRQSAVSLAAYFSPQIFFRPPPLLS
jgi:hypothetical protein